MTTIEQATAIEIQADALFTAHDFLGSAQAWEVAADAWRVIGSDDDAEQCQMGVNAALSAHYSWVLHTNGISTHEYTFSFSG